MIKKSTRKSDLLFIIMVLSVLVLHIYFLFSVPFSDDESHYVTVPFRLINGDSLVQHEWHLTQFASLFSYLPVRIFTAIKGSVDGILIFTRCVYLTIHTSVAVAIYRCLKGYGNWAVLASMMFFGQVSYGIQAISYQSMLSVFLMLFTLCLVSIYKNKSAKTYIFAGICFGCCCVCNPLFCVAFVLYLVGCGVWAKRQVLVEKIVGLKASLNSGKGKKLTKKQKREQKKQALEAFPEMENYNCFFNKEAIIRIMCGVFIVAIFAVVFFFLTGGKIDSIFNNIENLLSSSEYDVASKSIFARLWQTIGYFSLANFGMPWILPLLFVVMLFDKKRNNNSHRNLYIAVSVLWMILFIAGVLVKREIYLCALSLPFCMFSVVCYLLTEKKNKTLFRCMFAPCLVASFIHYLAADTHLAAVGVVLAVSNVAGVLFTKDLWEEMRIASTDDTEIVKKKAPSLQGVIVVAFCLQIAFYGVFYQYGQFYGKATPKVATGPYAGLHMTQKQCDNYNNAIKDLDVIKDISNEDDPVLIASFRNWMYLYLDRPMATYTTWYRGGLDIDLLTAYYKANPSKKPKYIYIEAPTLDEGVVQFNIDRLSEMFELTRQDLSNGVLLTVEDCKL